MLNHLSELLRLSDGTRFEIGGQERAGSGLEWPGAQHLAEFRLDFGLPVWRYELGGTVVEKRVHMLHQQNTVHVTYHLIHGGPVRIKLRPALHVRPLEGSVHGAIDEPYTITAVEDRLELSTTRGYPPLRLKVYGRRATFALDSGKLDNVHYRAEAQRGYADVGELWSPGYWSVDLTADDEHDARGVDRSLGHDRRARARAGRRRRARAARAAPRRRRPRRALGHRRRARPGRRPVRHHAGRPPGGRRAGARRGRRGPLDHRGLSLVHRLGPRHDDQPRGADVHDGPPRRGGLHPAHVRPVRARRPHPQHVPRRQQRGAVPHGGRDALVLPRARPVSRGDGRPRHARGAHAEARGDRAVPPRRHALRHPRRSQGRAPRPGRGRLSAHVDGRQVRRVGRDATARQGGGDQRPLVQRPPPLRGLDARGRGRRGSAPLRRPRPAMPPGVQRALLVPGGRVSPRRRRERGPGRQGRHGVPAESAPRHLARAPRARRGALGRGGRRRAREALDPRRPALALARSSRFQADLPRRSPDAGCRVSPGHGLGVAHRPVHRRVAQGAPRGPRGGAPLPRRLRPASGRGLRRIDQRGLRRDRALRAAGLRRAGVERRRSLALLGPHLRAGRGGMHQ